jgi:hypothetical protein
VQAGIGRDAAFQARITSLIGAACHESLMPGSRYHRPLARDLAAQLYFLLSTWKGDQRTRMRNRGWAPTQRTRTGMRTGMKMLDGANHSAKLVFGTVSIQYCIFFEYGFRALRPQPVTSPQSPHAPDPSLLYSTKYSTVLLYFVTRTYHERSSQSSQSTSPSNHRRQSASRRDHPCSR